MRDSGLQPRFSVTQTTAVFAVVLAGVFVYGAWRPLWHTDLWGHLAYGRLIWETGALPKTEPLLPLATNVPFIDTAWLSQIVGYAVERWEGVAGLQMLFGGLLTSISAAWLALAHRRVRDWRWVGAGLLIYLWLDWFHLYVIRPQLAGTGCYVVLLWRLTARRSSRRDGFGIPLLFALWANLHGSFLLGLALIGVFLTGRSVDILRRTRSPMAVRHDRRVRTLILWLALAAAGSAINPYGPALIPEVLNVARCPNLADLTEWQPLELQSQPGRSFAAAAIGLLVLSGVTPRRIQTWEGLLLVGLALGGLSSARLLTWWSPAAAYLLILHARATWRKFRRKPYEATAEPRRLIWTGIVCVAVVSALAASPLGRSPAAGKSEVSNSVSSFTPVSATEFLRERPPAGLVFNTYEWGDYLLWAGPPGLQVFVNSHAHLIPPEIWRDYLRMLRQDAGWRELLDLYDINTVVVDPLNRGALIDSLRNDPVWRVDFEDRVAVILTRR
ncbi:MAG TPA: hypothetical protein VL132_11695 [Planctomycetaceae bacterium]|nr:hypothetical protein [Planctomycetaceae bacterium]